MVAKSNWIVTSAPPCTVLTVSHQRIQWPLAQTLMSSNSRHRAHKRRGTQQSRTLSNRTCGWTLASLMPYSDQGESPGKSPGESPAIHFRQFTPRGIPAVWTGRGFCGWKINRGNSTLLWAGDSPGDSPGKNIFSPVWTTAGENRGENGKHNGQHTVVWQKWSVELKKYININLPHKHKFLKK